MARAQIAPKGSHRLLPHSKRRRTRLYGERSADLDTLTRMREHQVNPGYRLVFWLAGALR
ncbi:hypothetical protein J3A74_000138 [Rhodococcus sp. PvP104]|nr:hypothetical protein [Rhodococcus sp. PvP104]